MKAAKTITVTLPPDLLAGAEKLAKLDRTTKSALVREALRAYVLEREWAAVRKRAAERALASGIRTEQDIVDAVREVRRSRRENGKKK